MLERLNGAVEGTSDMDAATRLLNEEMATLINHDALSQPIMPDKSDPVVAASLSGGKKDKKDKKKRKHAAIMKENIPEVSLDYFPEEALDTAKNILAEEFKSIIQEKREILQSTKGVYYEEDDDVLNALTEDTIAAASNNASSVTSLQSEYTSLQSATKALTKTCSKLEQKLNIQTGGYTQRSTALIDSTLHSFAELQHSRIEQAVYTRLRAHETKGVSIRLEKLTDEVEQLEKEEMNKQRRYGDLQHEKNRLLLKMKKSKSPA